MPTPAARGIPAGMRCGFRGSSASGTTRLPTRSTRSRMSRASTNTRGAAGAAPLPSWPPCSQESGANMMKFSNLAVPSVASLASIAATITWRDRRDRRNRRLEWGWAVVGAALAAVCAVPLLAGGIAAGAEAATVFRIRVEGVVAPSSARFIQRAIREAEEANAAALLIELDTPGGLMKSMDDTTKAMLNARVPVLVYISPKGARAASAGVFVTYAAHVAAMAPATHLGAAHPVSVGQGGQQDQTMLEKVTNDAVANIGRMDGGAAGMGAGGGKAVAGG